MTELFVIPSGKHLYAVNQKKIKQKIPHFTRSIIFFIFCSATQHHIPLVFLNRNMFFLAQNAFLVDAEQIKHCCYLIIEHIQVKVQS